jgi:glycosyltransferase involved in cell wall biosynthesis
MSKLYIDITELVGWRGKITGVPRVMDEVSKRFANQEEIIFVEWRPQGYLEVKYPIDTAGLEHETKVSSLQRVTKKAYAKSRIFRKAVHATKRMKLPSENTYMQLRKGDTLFILADWHGGDPSFVKYLEDIHERGVRLVQMVYDMLPIVTPQYSGHSTEMLKNYSVKIYPICDLIFSISEHTKKDITEWLVSNRLNVPQIVVVRLGDDFSRIESRKPVNKDVPKDFILCVGTIEARKNHALLYYAYKLGMQKSISLPPVVIVGRVGWLAEDISKIMQLDPEVNSKFIFMHNVDDNELSWLYENCLFSVYPSFYEGWGLPIAESIAHKKPVVASNTSSMPEIAGDLISYFSPASPEECLQSIIELSDDSVRARALTRISQYKPYSWDETFYTIDKAIKGLV